LYGKLYLHDCSSAVFPSTSLCPQYEITTERAQITNIAFKKSSIILLKKLFGKLIIFVLKDLR
jgi:hypothetical protein